MSTLYAWGKRTVSAVADQGLFAVTNFGLNIVLARWLDAQSYGAFAVAYAIFILLITLENGLLSQPMLVYGTGKFAKQTGKYLGFTFILLGGLALLAVLFLAAGAGISWRYGSPELTSALIGLTIASPFILFRLTVRTATYVVLRPRLSVYAGVIYMIVVLSILFMLERYDWLSPAAALGAMAFGSLISASWIVGKLDIVRPKLRKSTLVREASRCHWEFGRWAIATGVLNWIPSQVYFLALPIWGGLHAAGTLRALGNVLMPLTHTYAALGLVLTTALVQVRGREMFMRVVWIVISGLSLLAISYWIIVGLLNQEILQFLYEQRYLEEGWLLWVLGLGPVVIVGMPVLAPALRSLERPDCVFWGYLASSVITLTVGLILLEKWGLLGAALGGIVSGVIASGTLLWLLVRLQPKEQN